MIMHVTLDWNLEKLNIIRVFLLQPHKLEASSDTAHTSFLPGVCARVQVPVWPCQTWEGRSSLVLLRREGVRPLTRPGFWLVGTQGLSTTPHLFHWHQMGRACTRRWWEKSWGSSRPPLCHQESRKGAPPSRRWTGVINGEGLSVRAVHAYPMGWKSELLLALSDAPRAAGTERGHR